jgi:hypothetical protein
MGKKMRASSKPSNNYHSQPIQRRTMRYQCSALQNNVAITPQHVALSLGTICSVANTYVVPLAAAVRVTRVRMWCVPPTSGSAANVIVNFTTTAVVSSTGEVGATSISTAQYAAIDTKPPKESTAAFWSKASDTNTLFTLYADSGAILELDIEYVHHGQEIAAGSLIYAITSGAATLHNVYYINLTASNTGFTPVFLPGNY